MFNISARLLLVASVTAGAPLCACAAVQTAPDAGRRGEEAIPTVGRVIGACERWEYPGATGAELVTVDAYFGWRPGRPRDRPREEDLRILRSQGAHILYAFRVPVARIQLPAEQLAALQGLANHARAVPDPERQDVLVDVIYSRQLSDSDLAHIQQFGGQVLERADRFRFVRAVLPDAAISDVRNQPGVAVVEMGGGLLCTDG